MQRKLLKRLVCVSGLLFIAFPAWSAVPSNLIHTDSSCNQEMATSDIASTLLEGDMIVAKGPGGGDGGNGNGNGGWGGKAGSGSGTGAQSQSQAQIQSQTKAQTMNTNGQDDQGSSGASQR